MPRLTKSKSEDWRAYRRLARLYERELIRISHASAVSAERLRQIAAEATVKRAAFFREE